MVSSIRGSVRTAPDGAVRRGAERTRW